MSDESSGGSECGYCGSSELVYEMEEMTRGRVYRCVECLAIEQLQQRFTLPFDRWVDRDDIHPPDGDDTPDFESFDPAEHDYHIARAWATVLARLKDDDPIVERDPDAIGTIYEDVRESLINLMGADAHKRPSELRSQTSHSEHADEDDDLAYGGVCPVCGDKFTDGFERLQDLKGESIEGVRICVIDPPEECLFHLPEDQNGRSQDTESEQ